MKRHSGQLTVGGKFHYISGKKSQLIRQIVNLALIIYFSLHNVSVNPKDCDSNDDVFRPQYLSAIYRLF